APGRRRAAAPPPDTPAPCPRHPVLNSPKSGVFTMDLTDLIIKLSFLIVFFGVMVFIGLYCRRHTADVSGFVLGGRSVGPWLTAFAYGTSYFSAVVFVGYAGQFGWKYGIAATWAGIGNALLGSLLAGELLGRQIGRASGRGGGEGGVGG